MVNLFGRKVVKVQMCPCEIGVSLEILCVFHLLPTFQNFANWCWSDGP